MNEPDVAFERKILLDVVEQMKEPESTARKQATLRKVTLGIGTTAMTAAFILALGKLVHPFIAAAVAALAGCAVGFAVFLEFAARQWPVTSKYIDMDAVRQRLAELED